MLSIKMLGDLKIEYDGDPITSFPSRKAEALLVYLAVESGTAHRRESLFTLLWPGMPEKSARHNLRQVLYALRQIFAEVAARDGDDPVPLLLADRHTVQINSQAAMDADIYQLDRNLEETQVHDHLSLDSCETCTQALKNVVDLCNGDFLSDFYLEDSNQFEDWVAANREAYRQKVLGALETLTEIFIQKADYDQARAYADQQLKIDSLREIAYRQLMELLSKSGQRAEALRVYQQCADKLEIELGTHPSRETTVLFEIIRGEDLRQSAATLHEGAIRGYEIREHLGTGHAGAVYRAYQPVIGRDVAIKVILPQFANHPDFIRRFEVEAQLVARLEHPHIVPLYDYWRDPSGAYLVMRWLKGGNLQADLARGPWKPTPAVGLVDQICAALSLAHRQGVVHCDIKPANILLDEESNAYLTDFGIAILTGPLAHLSQTLHSGNGGSSSGSLGYVSPETVRGLETTPLADIYSLGVVLYELLAGAHPFPGIEGEALVQKHLTEPLPSVLDQRPELPEAVDAVIQIATSKDPAKRFTDVDALAREFRLALIPESVVLAEVADTKVIARNPYKGLRPFAEADASDFFGRADLVDRLVARLSLENALVAPARFLAVVGPSGCGKSSVVKAGLIPAIRKGAIPGSEAWFVAEMTPGSHPLEEIKTALLRIAMETPDDLLEQLSTDPRGLIQVLRRALPGKDSQVLLVIDQFEETFTLVADEAQRTHFLAILSAAVRDPHSPLRLVITLRADFYDRPLEYSEFGELVREATEVVLPLTPEELERAICGPAEEVGASLEPALVARILQEVGDQPGALPLLQYALTETFEQREDHQLTLAAYEASGGVLGALGRRAEDIYGRLIPNQQNAARQMFLRLVTLGEGIEDTRRRVLRAEIDAVVGREPSLLVPVIDQYGYHRLLTFDHDPATRAPTVEIAHEALLREWPRLRTWLDESRADIRMQRLLDADTQEWLVTDRDPGFLLRGARLDQFALWIEDASVALTADELAYLDASLEKRREREAAEAERQVHEARLEQRSRRFLRALVGGFAVAALIAILLSGVALKQSSIAQENAAKATFAQGEAIELAAAEATSAADAREQQAFAEEQAAARATQQTIAEAEAEARAAAEAEAIAERNEAEEQANISLVNNLVAQSKLATDQPDLALLLSLEAQNRLDTPQSKGALLDAIQNNPGRVQFLSGHQAEIYHVAVSPDGKLAASADWGGSGILYWDIETGQLLRQSRPSDLSLIWNIFFLPNEPILLSAGCVIDESGLCIRDEFIFWDIATGNPIGDPVFYGAIEPEASALSPDGQMMAVIMCLDRQETGADVVRTHCNRRELTIWDIPTALNRATGESGDPVLNQITDLFPGLGVFYAMDFSPDGKIVAVGGCYDYLETDICEWSQLLLYDPETSQLINDISLVDHLSWLGSLAFSPDGSTLAAGGCTRDTVESETCLDEIIFLNPETGELVDQYPTGGETGKRSFAISPDGSTLAAAAHHVITLWDLESGGAIELPMIGHVGEITAITFSPDGKTLISGGLDATVAIWNLSTRGGIGTLFEKTDNPPYIWLSYSPDGEILAVGDGMGTIHLWDTDTGLPLAYAPIQAHEGYIYRVIFSGNGEIIASSNWNNKIRLWDRVTGEPIGPVLKASVTGAGSSGTFALAISPDGNTLAAGGEYGVYHGTDNPIYLWDIASITAGEPISRSLSGHTAAVTQITFSPDGKLMASSSWDLTIRLWDTETWENIGVIKETSAVMVLSVQFSPDGKTLASGNGSGLIHLWDVSTLEPIGVPLTGHTGTVWGVAFSPDGNILASASSDGTVRLWDVATGYPIGQPFTGHTWNVAGVAFHPNGKMLASSGRGGEIYLWDIDVESWRARACELVGRNFTPAEWETYLPGVPYQKTCPQWP